MESTFLDAHLHLQDARFVGLEKQVIDRARRYGVRRFLCNGTRECDWQAVLELAEYTDEVVAFLGVHPWFADTVSADWLNRLDVIVRTSGCGIGETGLDKRCRVEFGQQEQVLLGQLELACRYDRPLVMHCVRSWGKLIELLEQNASARNTPPMMIHSFSGSMETMERLSRMGIFLSFSGALLDPGQKKLQQVFAQTPMELLLLETDSPDQFFDDQGKKRVNICNEPMFIPALYEKAAQIRKMDLKQLSTIVWHNGSVFTHRKTFGK